MSRTDTRSRTLVRLAWAKRKCIRLGLYGRAWLKGSGADVQATWRRYGWRPRQEREAA